MTASPWAPNDIPATLRKPSHLSAVLAHPRAVCRKHELMQYDLETAAQDLASKKQQCEELATGVSALQVSGAGVVRWEWVRS